MASTHLPVPPAGAMAVIRAASEPDVKMNRLSAIVGAEPAMTAGLLRMANSAAYGIGRPVTTVSQATLYLGTRVLRNIAVHHVVRTTLAKVDAGRLDVAAFWEDSLRRASAASLLARRVGFPDPSEAFTLGLLLDMGTLVLAVYDRAKSLDLVRVARRPAPERLEVESRCFGRDHAATFAALATEWGLPSDLVEIIAAHHRDDVVLPQHDRDRLLRIARAADALSDVVQTNAADGTVQVAERAIGALELTAPLAELVTDLAEAMEAASRDLQIRIGRPPTWDELMTRANGTLLSVNTSLDELNRKLEKALEERDTALRELERANEMFQTMARTDPLTQLANRRAFTEESQMTAGNPDEVPFALLMLDLDHFKKINDVYGHAAGDGVLVEVSKRLATVVRPGDVVGRLGGEEFAILLPACTPDQGAQVAERVRAAIEASPVKSRDGIDIPITVSIGGTSIGFIGSNFDEVLSKADAALYQSKAEGRNRVTFCGSDRNFAPISLASATRPHRCSSSP